MASPADYGMVSVNGGENWTNAPGTGLDASGNLLPGYKYGTYSNGIGQGTPVRIGGLGLGGQTVTGNAPPAAGTYNPNITVGPQQQAAPSTANMAVNNPANTFVSPFDGLTYENRMHYRAGMSGAGGPQQYANPTTQNMAPQYQGNTMQRFTGNQFFGQQQPSYAQYPSSEWANRTANVSGGSNNWDTYTYKPASMGTSSPYTQQQSPFAYQNPFQSSTYSQPSGQAFNTQNNPFNRSNQGGLLSGGGYQFGGLLNY